VSNPVYHNPFDEWGFYRASDAGDASIGSFIAGGVARSDLVPGPYKIIVLGRNGSTSLHPVAAVTAAADGTWQLDGLKEGRYYMALLLDRTRTLNAGVLDWMQATTPPTE
jgi:hypothetical protein